MRNKLREYNVYLDKVIVNKEIKDIEIKEILEELLIKIKFFQHERLIHLIVCVFVGISALLCLGFALILENTLMILLFLLLLILFFIYIVHYYYLENGIQSLYTKYFKIKDKKREFLK